MIGIVIVAHEGLADEYKAALEHVVGQQEQLITVGIDENYNRKSKEIEICNASDNVDTGFGVILVTDLFGGSPSNLALSACCKEDRTIIYGANLPMLVKLAKCRKMSRKDATEEALNAGRKYIDSYNRQ